MTMLIQGSGCRLWLETMLDKINLELTKPNECRSETNFNSCSPETQARKPNSKRKSSSLLSTVSNVLFGPSLDKEILKLGKEMKKAKKAAKKGGFEIDQEYFSKKLQEIQSTSNEKKLSRPANYPAKSASPINSNFKQYHQKPTETQSQTVNYKVQRNETSVKSLNEETHVKSIIRVSEDDSYEINSDTTSLSHSCISSSPKSVISRSSTTEKCDFSVQCDLQEVLNMNYSKSQDTDILNLKSENEKLQSVINNLKDRLSENKTSNSDQNAKILILEEEMSKLKITNQSLKQENKALREKASAKQIEQDCINTLQTDVLSIKEQFEELASSLDLVKNRIENASSKTDINSLQHEIHLLRKELVNDGGTQNEISTTVQTANQNTKDFVTSSNNTKSLSPSKPCQKPVDTEKNSSTPGRSTNPTTKKYEVLILGDSVTKGLIRKKMSSQQVNVSIKSTSEATIQDINKIITHNKTQTKEADIIVLHTGIKNISNANSPQSICEDFTNLVTSIQSANQNVKIAVSSILPKRRDLLSKKNIDEANSLLEKLCKNKGFLFLDNSSAFMKYDKVNQNLYYDEVQLNKEGSAILGRQINAGIRKILGINSYSSRQQENNFSTERVNFRNANIWHGYARRHQHPQQRFRMYQGPWDPWPRTTRMGPHQFY
jgi:lysophospholipase L1-like esterase